jgi:hypothetical protein
MQSGNTNSTNEKDKEGEYQHKSWSEHAEIVARWVVDLFAIPSSFAAALLEQFVGQGGSGKKILGMIGFWGGTLFGADGIWQLLFQGVPLFPFCESNWIGWIGWIQLPFNPLFWISIAISALVQVQEAKTLRSKPPAVAKQEFEEAKQYGLPEKPKNTIDLGRALWGDYKRAGMRERKSGGLIALFFWGFDLSSTFITRWPWRYSNPAAILGCLVYNIFTMGAGEVGYHIWKHSK